MKLLVVDDSALMRRLLARLFEPERDIELAFARDGLEAVALLHQFRPDVITLDVHMPNLDGLACLDRIMLERPTRVVMLSSLTEAGAEVTLNALALGAVDFITKPAGAISLGFDRLGPALVETVRAAAQAQVRHSRRLVERVRHRTAATAPPPCRGKGRRPEWSASRGAVLVGASTGGPPALEALLSPLPAEFPSPILIAQHMPAAFTGPLARRLDRMCALTVVEVTQPMPLRPGHAYVGPGEADLIVSSRPSGPVAMAAPAAAEHRWHPSVDRLVTSALAHLDPSALAGVLMTGMGDDGAASMARLREAGGHTIAEARETAVVWGMPGELVRRDGAALVARLDAIAGHLRDWAA